MQLVGSDRYKFKSRLYVCLENECSLPSAFENHPADFVYAGILYSKGIRVDEVVYCPSRGLGEVEYQQGAAVGFWSRAERIDYKTWQGRGSKWPSSKSRRYFSFYGSSHSSSVFTGRAIIGRESRWHVAHYPKVGSRPETAAHVLDQMWLDPVNAAQPP